MKYSPAVTGPYFQEIQEKHVLLLDWPRMSFAGQLENSTGGRWLARSVWTGATAVNRADHCQFAGVKRPVAPPVSLGLICGPICLPCSLVQSTKHSRLAGEFCSFFSASTSLFWRLSFSPRKDVIVHRRLRGRYFLLLLKIVFTWTLTYNFFCESNLMNVYIILMFKWETKTFTSSSGV